MKEYKKSDTLENYMFLKSVLDMDEVLKQTNFNMLKDFILIAVAFILAVSSIIIPPLCLVTAGFVFFSIIKPNIYKIKNDNIKKIDKKLKIFSENSKFKSMTVDNLEQNMEIIETEVDKYSKALSKQQEQKKSSLNGVSLEKPILRKSTTQIMINEKPETDKYEDVLNKQLEAKQTPVDDIYQIINTWYLNYNLPELDISPKQLEQFWNKFYSFLLKYNFESDEIYQIMKFVAGLVFQGFCNVEGVKITIKDLINGLSYLNSYNSFKMAKCFKSKDILLFQKELISEFNKTTVIDFTRIRKP